MRPGLLCRLLVLAALLLLAAVPAAASDVEVRAALEPEVLAPGQHTFFSIEVSGGVFDKVTFEPRFELVNLEALGGEPAASHNLRWVNGTTSRSVKLTWRLQALELGPAAVQGISVQVGGQRYDLPAVTARVVSDPPPSSRRRGPTAQQPGRPGWNLPDSLRDLFERRLRREPEERPEIRLVAEASPQRPWAGQQITYTLWLYTQTNIARVSVKEMPEMRGFWVEEVERQGNPTPEMVEVDGERFWRTPLLQRALFPLRPGLYTIDPAEVYLVARSISNDPFSPNLPRTEQMVRASDSLTLDVRPLPPVPADLADRWSGPVGQLALEARLVPSEMAVGDAATLELTLSGQGNVEGLAPPEPAVPEGLRVLPAEISGGNRLEGARVVAERTWSFPLVPQRPDTWRLPPVEMTYFDPAAGRYRVASGPPLLLRARRGEPLSAAAGRPALHPLKNAALPVEDRRGWPRVLPWLFGLSWILVLSTALVRWQRDGKGEADEPLERFLRRLDGDGDDRSRRERPRHAALALEAAWRDFLAERFDVPPGAPPSRWRDHLEKHGTDPRLGADLDELVQDLQYLRHAPQLSTIADLSEDLRVRSGRLGRKLAGG